VDKNIQSTDTLAAQFSSIGEWSSWRPSSKAKTDHALNIVPAAFAHFAQNIHSMHLH
jgi:hypothetical protein